MSRSIIRLEALHLILQRMWDEDQHPAVPHDTSHILLQYNFMVAVLMYALHATIQSCPHRRLS